LTARNDGISTQLHHILHRNRRILQKSPALKVKACGYSPSTPSRAGCPEWDRKRHTSMPMSQVPGYCHP
jgi:hypothetical protein